ncbi:hypothetical protein WDU94_012495 [Cyamophila willieti]
MQSEPLLMGKSHVYHHNLPYVAHKRLVHYTTMPAPLPHNSVRNSVIANELDRIQNRSRPHFSHIPTEDYLNSRSVVNFDDDVRNIRAHTAALLKRVQAPIPRAARMPLSSAFDHIETAIPDRITSDAYISTMLSPRNNVERIVQKMCQYPEINEKANIGTHSRAMVTARHRVSSKGRLACVTFAGGKAYPRRSRHVMVSGSGSDEARNVMADITMLSYYNKARSGAEEVATHEGEDKPSVSVSAPDN